MKRPQKGYLFAWISILLPLLSPAQSSTVSQVKLSHFNLQSSAVIKASGADLSDPHYVERDYWFPVNVPSTVLTGLVANKVYPDPYNGMNNLLIPDASDEFNHQYHLEQYSHLPNEPNPWKKPYWYRTEFSVPAGDKGKNFSLVFKGINYRAEVWVNGMLIADSSQMVGMFAEFALNVSKAIKAGQSNGLAVKIYPLDYPGLPSHPQLNALGDFYENGGPNGDIAKNVTMLCSVGWDWIPEVRDRNMGIWQPVYLRTTGRVVISKPHIVTELPSLPDTSLAKLSIALNLSNYSAEARKGKLRVTISPENFTGGSISFDKELTLDASGSKTVSLSAADTRELLIHQPHLWWPIGYGAPNLYRIHLQWLDGEAVSDDISFCYGIRTVDSKATDVKGWIRRDFYVNGRRVHLVGGAWVPDMMLNRDSLRYDYEMHLCATGNVNLLRIWGGGLGETDDFYESADRYGLLVWQDFWVTGDTNGGFKGSSDYPLETHVFVDNVISTILRIRNHPSLLVWTGGNEGHAREELYNAMRDNVAKLDGTRPFVPCSSGFSKAPKTWKGSWPDNLAAGVYSGGPYWWMEDAAYYRLVDGGKDWVFKDETGIPSQPPYNTLAKIIPDLVPDSTLPYPLNNSWGYHDACTGNGKYQVYYKAMVDEFGAATSLKDFSGKMQLLNAGGYRGIFEAAGHKLNETGGVLLWKLNAAFPSVVWQVYDWYLEPNAGFYFMQRACEPVHIQLNLDDSVVAVVNRTYEARAHLTFHAELLGLDGSSLYKQGGVVDLKTTDVKEVLPLRGLLAKTTGISFLVLELKDDQGKLVSHNVYWMSPHHDFKGLRRMPGARVEIKVFGSEWSGSDKKWRVQMTNTSHQLAFFLNPQLIKQGEEVLPSFWSDNYFSLAAGESRTVTVTCPIAELGAVDPDLRLEGWNLEAQTILHL